MTTSIKWLAGIGVREDGSVERYERRGERLEHVETFQPHQDVRLGAHTLKRGSSGDESIEG